jgi:hypothetical protein
MFRNLVSRVIDFTLHDEFAAKLPISNLRGTVHTIESFSAYRQKGASIQEVYTIPGTGIADIDKRIVEDEAIDTQLLTIILDTGRTITVPDKYIALVNRDNMIEYVDKTIILKIGAHVDGVKHTELMNNLAKLVKGIEGVTPKIEILNTSAIGYKALSDHEQIRTARNAAKTGFDTTSTLEAQIALLKAENAAILACCG